MRSTLLRTTRRIALVLLFAAAGYQPAAAYENPDLSRSAEAWLKSLKAEFGDRTDLAAARQSWSQAYRWSRQRRWGPAVGAYSRAAALGLDEHGMWLQMSQALSSKRPPDNEAALHAAYHGYRTADTDKERALALHHIGYRYQLLDKGEEAIAAYEESLSLEENRTARQRLETVLAKHRHHITRAYTRAETDQPQLCLEFSRELPPADAFQYRDYVVVEPAFETTFQVAGNTLCIGGARHGETYALTVRAGLPSTTELKLSKAREFSLSVPDRSPTLGFRGGAHILPKVSRQGIPLTSVNVEKAKLGLYRIGDRNLVDQLNNSQLRSLLTGYEARRVANTDGELVWEGSMDLKMELNREITTAIPAERMLQNPRPGVYVLIAEPADEEKREADYNARATQWLVLTDIALSTFEGTDGLHAFARSYDTAKPMAGVRLQLLARNNEVLGEGETGPDGRAHFEAGLLRGEGGNRPAAVIARGDGDFAFLDLQRPAFDLSDRGVAGRQTPGPVDAFLYPERGVYRPGEIVHLTGLLRDDRGVAVRDMPVTLRLRRPDGVVAERFTVSADAAREGAFTMEIPLSKASHTGRWSVQAFVDPKGKPVGAATFQVEDFVPERLEMTLTPGSENLVPGTPTEIGIEGRFLYGAPAANLRVEGELVIRQDMSPYPDWKGYQFGLVTETWDATRVDLDPVKTDARGKATLAVGIDELPETTRPTKAEVRVTLNETGGRAIQRVVSIPVRGQPLVIGIERDGEGRYVSESEDAEFRVIALDDEGKRRAARELSYRLVRENYQYQWYFKDNRWNYRVIRTDEPVSSGTLDIGAESPAALSFRNDWGSYRLIVEDPATGVATSLRYHVGWFTRPGAENVPDRLSVSLDKDGYRAGETARVHIQPPFDGQVHLVVASDRLLLSRMVEVPRDGRTIEIEVEEEWGPGTYVTAAAYRPTSQRENRGPSRAIGVAHLGRDFSRRTLDVSIEAPERIVPRRAVDVTVRVGNTVGGSAYITLAAVDEGILSLTGYRTPDPADHYFGQRRLGMDLRDAYGFLIDPYAGRLGEIRQGGDAAARERHLGGLDASSIKTVSLFSGLVKVDRNGEAKVTLDVPDFNGRLRLMAVALDREAVGSASAEMTVRDPVVSIVTLPRFLAPGDKARVSVSLHNVDGPAGTYSLSMAADGAAARFAGSGFEGTLASDARKDLAFELEGKTVGVTTVSMTLAGPGGFEVERSWQIAVRPAQATVSRYRSGKIAAGGTERYTRALFAEMLPGTGRAYVTLSSYPDWGMAGLVRALDRYPYGCTEQTTSRALPLLHLAEVANNIGLEMDGKEVRQRVQNAINRLSMMQRSDGAFGLWSAYDEREDWLSAYVMDFLTQAREQGYFVPDPVFERGLARLDIAVRRGSTDVYNLHILAYAHYVLARNRKARLGDLRYFHDNHLKDIPTAFSKAQLAAALALYGDEARAESAFAASRRHQSRPARSGNYWNVAYRDYGTTLRDAAGVLYFLTQSGNRSIRSDDLVLQIARDRAAKRYLSTQEQSWMLLAARGLMDGGAPMTIDVGDQTLSERTRPYNLRLEAKTIGEGTAVENRGDAPVWAGVSVTGIPATDLPAEEQGFEIKRTFYTIDNKPVDLADVRQGDVMVALIEVRPTGKGNHQALVVDLLPSGFEIENARLGGRDVEQMSWLPDLAAPRHVEPRDDRFVAAIDLTSKKKPVYLAYVVRAVTPGQFRLPAIHVEDMYRPNFFARTEMGDVAIRPQE